jgi:hypothetical protein
MSTKAQKPKVVKIKKELPVVSEEDSKVESKPRKPRAKKQPPTKEEVLANMLATLNELKQIIADLKEDEQKLSGMMSQLKRVPDLLKVSIENMEEDVKELDEHYQEILAAPAEIS